MYLKILFRQFSTNIIKNKLHADQVKRDLIPKYFKPERIKKWEIQINKKWASIPSENFPKKEVSFLLRNKNLNFGEKKLLLEQDIHFIKKILEGILVIPIQVKDLDITRNNIPHYINQINLTNHQIQDNIMDSILNVKSKFKLPEIDFLKSLFYNFALNQIDKMNANKMFEISESVFFGNNLTQLEFSNIIQHPFYYYNSNDTSIHKMKDNLTKNNYIKEEIQENTSNCNDNLYLQNLKVRIVEKKRSNKSEFIPEDLIRKFHVKSIEFKYKNNIDSEGIPNYNLFELKSSKEYMLIKFNFKDIEKNDYAHKYKESSNTPPTNNIKNFKGEKLSKSNSNIHNLISQNFFKCSSSLLSITSNVEIIDEISFILISPKILENPKYTFLKNYLIDKGILTNNDIINFTENSLNTSLLVKNPITNNDIPVFLSRLADSEPNYTLLGFPSINKEHLNFALENLCNFLPKNDLREFEFKSNYFDNLMNKRKKNIEVLIEKNHGIPVYYDPNNIILGFENNCIFPISGKICSKCLSNLNNMEEINKENNSTLLLKKTQDLIISNISLLHCHKCANQSKAILSELNQIFVNALLIYSISYVMNLVFLNKSSIFTLFMLRDTLNNFTYHLVEIYDLLKKINCFSNLQEINSLNKNCNLKRNEIKNLNANQILIFQKLWTEENLNEYGIDFLRLSVNVTDFDSIDRIIEKISRFNLKTFILGMKIRKLLMENQIIFKDYQELIKSENKIILKMYQNSNYYVKRINLSYNLIEHLFEWQRELRNFFKKKFEVNSKNKSYELLEEFTYQYLLFLRVLFPYEPYLTGVIWRKILSKINKCNRFNLSTNIWDKQNLLIDNLNKDLQNKLVSIYYKSELIGKNVVIPKSVIHNDLVYYICEKFPKIKKASLDQTYSIKPFKVEGKNPKIFFSQNHFN